MLGTVHILYLVHTNTQRLGLIWILNATPCGKRSMDSNSNFVNEGTRDLGFRLRMLLFEFG